MAAMPVQVPVYARADGAAGRRQAILPGRNNARIGEYLYNRLSTGAGWKRRQKGVDPVYIGLVRLHLQLQDGVCWEM